MTDATDGLLLDTLIGIPRAGAIRASSTSMMETPPGPIVEGVSVTWRISGAGGSVPPGLTVSVDGTETSWRLTSEVSVYARSTNRLTFAGELTTAVGKATLTDV